jgi:hypothetical protein
MEFSEVKGKKEKCKLQRRNSHYYSVEVIKREENTKQSKRKKVIGQGDQG